MKGIHVLLHYSSGIHLSSLTPHVCVVAFSLEITFASGSFHSNYHPSYSLGPVLMQ